MKSLFAAASLVAVIIGESALTMPVFGQATVATNNIGINDYLGTQAGNANDLLFRTNGFERARIKADGAFLYSSQTGVTPISYATYGTGPRMFYVPNLGGKNGAFRAGYVDNTSWDDVNIGNISAAFGYNTIANGYTSFAINSNTMASGDRSFSSGYLSVASGIRSTATGEATTASGFATASFNYATTASGTASSSFNYSTTAQAYAEAVFGRFNVTSASYSATSWITTDPLFVIGNGGSAATPANAVTVLKNGNVGIGYANPNTAGVLLDVNGGVRGTTAYQISDARYKKNIEPITGALEKVLRLEGMAYDWRRDEFPQINFPERKQLGFIAQQVKEIIPEAVIEDGNGYYSVSYTEIVPVLAEAVKQQQGIIGAQEKEIARLGERLAKLEAATTDADARFEENAGGAAGVSLGQNIPNPTGEFTTIPYVLPASVTDAKLVISEAASGSELRRLPLTGHGAGSVMVSTSDLSSGNYIYAIVIDGKIMQSRTMVVAR